MSKHPDEGRQESDERGLRSLLDVYEVPTYISQAEQIMARLEAEEAKAVSVSAPASTMGRWPWRMAWLGGVCSCALVLCWMVVGTIRTHQAKLQVHRDAPRRDAPYKERAGAASGKALSAQRVLASLSVTGELCRVEKRHICLQKARQMGLVVPSASQVPLYEYQGGTILQQRAPGATPVDLFPEEFHRYTR